MDIQTLLKESRAEELVGAFGIQTECGKQSFQKQIQHFSSQVPALQRRRNAILSLQKELHTYPERAEELDRLFGELKSVEKEIEVFYTPSTVEKNSFEQLTFSGYSWTKVFNTIPLVLYCLSMFKLYLVPALALLSPLLMLIGPYLLLLYVYELPITTEQYIEIMMQTMGLSNQMTPKVMLQVGLTLFSVVQSIVQPIQNAMHLQTIHKDLLEKGESVLKLEDIRRKIVSLLPEHNFHLPSLSEEGLDTYRAFTLGWDEPYRLKLILSILGDVEVLYRVAMHPKIQGVKFKTNKTVCLMIQNGIDPFMEAAVPFSVRFSKKTHCILTGPNRGGKSSVLRTTLLYVLLAQTFGVSFSSCSLAPFHWLAAGLKLEDRPGKSSMFEREVEFAVSILRKAQQRNLRGMIFFDELFHSTNPPDGTRTAELFLSKVWKMPNLASFISTHVFHLAESSPDHVQKLCVPAEVRGGGSLYFHYTLRQGICSVSSVDSILREKGLLSGRAESYSPENRQTQKK